MKPFALVVVAAAMAATAAGAVSRERVTAVLSSKPAALEPGRAWQALFTLRRGRRPIVRAQATFWIRDTAGSRAFRARALGGGRYRATVIFPAAGRWRIGVSVAAASVPLGSLVVAVRIREPLGLAVGPDGALYVAGRASRAVFRVDPATRAVSIVARGFRGPLHLTFDRDGRLFVADGDSSIYRVDASGARTRVAGNGTRGHTGDGGPATAAALGGPGGIDFDADGNLLVAEYDGWIRIVRPDGTIGTIAGTGGEGYAGDGGSATDAVLRHPHDVEALADRTILIADSHNGAIRQIGRDGVITTTLSGLAGPIALAETQDGGYVVAAALENRIYRIDGAGRRTLASDARSTGVAADAAGNVYFAEFDLDRVRRVTPTGQVTTVVP